MCSSDLQSSSFLSLEPAALRAASATSPSSLLDKLDRGGGEGVSGSTKAEPVLVQAWAATRLGEVN